MDANWHPDPTGRFGQRFFDGRAWTDHVVGANGQTIADPLSDTYPPPPPGSAVATRTVATTSGASFVDGPRTTSWYGMAVAGVGVLLTLLSLYVLDWADGVAASDIRDSIPSSLPSGLDIEDVVAFRYVEWGGLILLLGSVVALAVVAAGIRRQDGDGGRVAGALVAALGAVFHTFTVVRMFRGGDPAVGAWLGTVGFVVVIAGFAVATPKTRRTQ